MKKSDLIRLGFRVVSAHEALKTDAKTAPERYSLSTGSLHPTNVLDGEQGQVSRGGGRLTRERST
ncbi:MAG: hypothetical protein COV31_01935 [Candidatus Yanofskybacteria bacterium CG10_big_fil_rev_8_21_14_0_10_46_23]|uniref:Uncharacterized protein n=1 Tax=Candidatus Yanofskybacteria bacterium CG10_big_fil_rev_8_21_14_0_10_46_23 TaxID=1975098 RepID=A0A2H0R4Q8_9BACT|nr:MAG: hypothetical protein COV31_01935 [Candidatus Yanofskybacteria bacterium CG10_big_fil_rev_8_21_14_0_10_46_23]